MANLRIISKNQVELTTTTLTASSTASASTQVTNLKLNPKSVVWRSATSSTESVKANLVVNFTTQMVTVGGVVLGFSNLTSDATIRIRGFIGTAPTLAGTTDVPLVNATGTQVFDTGFIVGTAPQNLGDWLWGVSELGPTAYLNRKGYARVWVPPASQIPCTSLAIEIVDPFNTDQYVEVSKLIVGSYWSPQYNTSFGLSSKQNDMSTSERSESGDLITTNGPTYNSMSFDLKYMSKKDRVEFNSLSRSSGLKKPMFISLFPENSADTGKEQLYQMYGKLSQLYGIEHPIFENYSSQVELEEI